MRVLALHGLGASGALLKKQLAPFIRGLGASFQFVFLDGSIECGRGPAVPDWEPGPFHSYVTGFSPQEMQEALKKIDDFSKEYGPFDGILGFSLGSAMAISYILERQRSKPGLQPPFSFAILFSPIFVASADHHCYEDLVSSILDADHAKFRELFPNGNFGSLLDSSEERIFSEYLSVVLSMHTSVGNILPNTRLDFLSFEAHAENVPRLLHPEIYRPRIRIPTLHISGTKDAPAMAEQTRVAEGLYTPSLLQTYRHDGGHDIPFKKSDVQAIISMVRVAAEKGKQLQELYDF